jgi:hypothetical protein
MSEKKPGKRGRIGSREAGRKQGLEEDQGG